jgi:elongation factor P
MDVSEIRKNTKLLIDNVPYNVEDAEFLKPGKGRAIFKFKMRNLNDGTTINRTFHDGETVQGVDVATTKEQYLYKDDENYVFMNVATFEQKHIPGEMLGNKKYFLKDGMEVQVMMMGDKPLDVMMPNFVELTVVSSSASTKTDTITAQNKKVQLETGYMIDVPTFIQEGNVIKVDTRSGNYVERINVKR